MKLEEILAIYRQDERTELLLNRIKNLEAPRIQLKGLIGASRSLLAATVFEEEAFVHFFIINDKESAAHFYNDLENLLGEKAMDYNKKKVLFYPTSYKRPYEPEKTDNANVLMRAEVLNRINANPKRGIIVTYPEALIERVVSKKFLSSNTLKLKKGEQVSVDFVADLLNEYDFERTDFVVEPGQFSIRGGIIDVFGFSNDYPFRIEFFGNEVESIRSFDPESQLSNDRLSFVNILPDVQNRKLVEIKESILSYLPLHSIIWFDDVAFTVDKINQEFEKAERIFSELTGDTIQHEPNQIFIDGKAFFSQLSERTIIEFGKQFFFKTDEVFEYDMKPQPSFNKNFEILLKKLEQNAASGFKNFIAADNPKQSERIYTILNDIRKDQEQNESLFYPLFFALHEGFEDHKLKISCYTDHQIFERYHKFVLRDRLKGKEALTLKEIYDLNPGDYVTHIDHGIGRFDGLEKLEVNGKQQEAIRLTYKDNDLLYVSIHSLHRIAKYVGKEGKAPPMHRLGSNVWKTLKNKTKNRVKDIAKELIKLYASRKSTEGFPFSPDSYLQHELEASFIYEDTPDQVKATADVKKDMEAAHPMDRLICGDVGFGKTEIAIRAAFKSVAESKQVALLVPTTILALQHYNTFTDRLKEFPCKVAYISRFKTPKQQKETLEGVANGSIDILIGTHRMISKDVKFKDLGLLIIDEEQKFGVAAKEKIKQLKVNVDNLTLTATPIPRTLQFSLMGARDLSVINTPPPNRYPVQTELHSFSETIIRDAIHYELSRGGQVYFVHNRIQNIMEVAGMIQRLIPDARVAVGHGQLEGHKLERIMLDFINIEYDILVATTIIESGLDIPNVNTIIINEAQNYGLSDLHQLRGRVGRTNKKAFCYLLAPPLSVVSDEARKRLKAIEEFSDLGSGFNIAMRDLDIRGAGNILGAEQSGFISDIGFEMYHKILDEALSELKENEFRELFKQDEDRDYISDCVIETDLEILIPDDYITNIAERLSLYKEIDNIETEDGLHSFNDRLTDRFGPIPPQTLELIDTIRFRWLAKKIGFEKVVLINGKFIGYFISNQESPYYQSPRFSAVLKYVQQNPQKCRMKEAKNKLSITFPNISGIHDALEVLRAMDISYE
ncbi:transcription-repair coupling factor [candidate division KSB1 bacterium]